jgi:uncharacterized protein YndB with AHSA1/START domain
MFKREELGEIIDGHKLRFVRTVKHSPERVWRALTDARELEAWMRFPPVEFEAREGGRVRFFADEIRIEGRVFVCDPPSTLAYSFADPGNEEHVAAAERTWSVRWQLEATSDGCRITFEHRLLTGPHLWGLGEGWHGFLDQLVAYFDGDLDALWSEPKRLKEARDVSGLRFYRQHVTGELASWTGETLSRLRRAITSGQQEDALHEIDRVELAVRQLHRIARQEGPVPDYSMDNADPVTP